MTTGSAAQVDVVNIAREVFRRGWSRAAEVSRSARESQAICKEWQRLVQAVDPVRFDIEVKVSKAFRERIDLVDKVIGTAYEVKVLGKNPAHECFKDVFKNTRAQSVGWWRYSASCLPHGPRRCESASRWARPIAAGKLV